MGTFICKGKSISTPLLFLIYSLLSLFLFIFMWCHLSEICHLLNKLRNSKLRGWLALWLWWVPSAPGAEWGLRPFLLTYFPQSPAGSSCGKLWGSLVPRAGNSGVVASPSRKTEVTAAASDGRTTGNSGWRWPRYRACCWGSLAWPAAVSLASASRVSEGESYPVPSCHVAAVSSLQFDSLLWGWKEALWLCSSFHNSSLGCHGCAMALVGRGR